jgi:hypothetical protein
MMSGRCGFLRGRYNSRGGCCCCCDADSDRARGDPGGSARTRGSARTGSSGARAGPATCGRTTTARSGSSLSKHLQRNRKGKNQQECNAY